MENKDTKEYKYDAFISYRHAKLDQFVAENLHKLLEMFKVPYIAADSVKKQKKNKINRVFRDRDELPLSSNLSENIQNALETSEFLIVICSPRTPESLWVQKEISTFISLHGREKVLAVLIEGEPEQSFPRELCFEQVEKILEDGTTCTVEQVVEPLAADVRGKNKKEVYKNLKKELLRLAAPLLGCSYDDLKQRHRERKIKRMMMASIAVATIFLVFGSISMAMALQIKKQSVLIQEQSEEIEKQYQEVLKRQAQTLADTSTELLAEGNRIAAIQVAKEALTEMPYTEQAQYALTEALRVYENGEKIMPAHLLQMETNISNFYVSPEGNRILAVDSVGRMMVWDANSGEEMCSLPSMAGFSIVGETECGFIDEKRIFLPKENNVVIYDIESQKELFSFSCSGRYVIAVHKGSNQFAVADSEKISILDLETYAVKAEFMPEESWQWLDELNFNESGTLLGCNVEYSLDSGKVLVLDVKKGECISELSSDGKEIADIFFIDEEYLAISVHDPFDYEAGSYTRSTIEFCEARNGNRKWSAVLNGEGISDIKLLNDKRELVCLSYNRATTLDVENGNEIVKVEFDSEIVGGIPIGEQNILLMLRDGRAMYVIGDTGDVFDQGSFFNTNSSNLLDFQIGKGYYASMPHMSKAITICKSTMGNEAEGIANFQEIIKTAVFDKERKAYLVQLYGSLDQGKVYLIDAEKVEKLADFELEDMINAAFFLGENEEQIGILTDDAVYVYDRSGTLLQKADFEGYGEEFVSVNEDRSRFIVMVDEKLQCFETATLKVVDEFLLESAYTLKAMGEKQQYCAVIAKEEEELQVFEFSTAEKKNAVPINSAFVSNIFMDEAENVIFVTYRDDMVEVYDRETLELKKVFTNFQETVTACKTVDGKNAYILQGLVESYVCNADSFEVFARVPQFADVDSEGENLLVTNNKNLLKIPLYSLEKLLEEAGQQLNGRVLSEEERERYHLGEISETETTVEEQN